MEINHLEGSNTVLTELRKGSVYPSLSRVTQDNTPVKEEEYKVYSKLRT